MFRGVLVAAAASAAVFFVSPAAAQSDYNWTGIYAGVHGGAGYGAAKGEAGIDGTVEGCLFNACDTFDFDESADDEYGLMGLLGGAQVGADYQLGNFVVGVKADISATDLSGEGTLADITVGPFGPIDPITIFSAGVATDVDWMATVRGRAGVTGPHGSLLYLTGGLAIADVESTLSYTTLLGGDSVSQTDTRYGWTAGIGGEAPITRNITFGLEYLYTDLGSWNVFSDSGSSGTITCGPPFGCNGVETNWNIAAENDLQIHTWRAALNIRLGGGPTN